jgi:hypothetical protein
LLVLASCTQAKRGESSERCLMRNHRNVGSATAVVRPWRRSTAREKLRTRARHLYKGAYWHAVQSLREQTRSTVYVVSAGFGLVSDEQELPTYSATFRPGHRDSVPGARTMQGRRAWWASLGGSNGLDALGLEREALLVVLPDVYLRIVEEDLARLVTRFGPEKVVIFGPRRRQHLQVALSEAWIGVESRMVRELGTNVSALAPAAAIRCAMAMGNEIDHDGCRAVMAQLVPDGAPALYPKRRRCDEDEVRQWLRMSLASPAPPSSATVALRAFRQQGMAFEQKRFHRLFHDVVATRTKEGKL